MANVWLQYGLARHHPEHGLEVLTARGILRPGVVSLPSPPIFMVKAGAFLRQRFGGPWTPWLALLGLNGIVFFALIFQRKQAQRFERTGIPGWLEVTLVSLLTLLVALPAMTFPEFYGTTAQEYPVLGETQFSRLLILYTLALGLPLTWHVRNTSMRKKRRFLQTLGHLSEGVSRPFRWSVYLNLGVVLAFFIVVYFSVEVNCTGLWSLLFTLWWTMICEHLAQWILYKRIATKQVPLNPKALGVQEHPAFQRAASAWKIKKLDHVEVSALELSPTCHGVNGLSHSILSERLFPGASRYRGLRSLGERTSNMAAPGSRLLRIGKELYRASHPLLEGLRAGRWEYAMLRACSPKLQSLWLRRAGYRLNHHLLPLLKKRMEQVQHAASFCYTQTRTVPNSQRA